jgi:hypothetical protein
MNVLVALLLIAVPALAGEDEARVKFPTLPSLKEKTFFLSTDAGVSNFMADRTRGRGNVDTRGEIAEMLS